MFYQWNSKVGWSVTNPLVSSDMTVTQWDNDWIGNNATAWENANNPCPKGWRIPTVAELKKLIEAGGRWSTVNGVEGRIFGQGYNAIFLPASGNRLYDGVLNNNNLIGNYWSNARHSTTQATNMYFHNGYANLPPRDKNHADRAYGLSCRCVADPEANLNPDPDEDTDTEPDEESDASNRLVGVWEGSYVASQGETGLTLTVYKEGGNYKAIFDFYNLPGETNAAEGKYYMTVSYDESTKKYYLEGYEWIVQPGYAFVDLEGTITGDVFSGNVVAWGRIYGPFQVVRK
jgi:uncharacterized protein (TIGR02145 family)